MSVKYFKGKLILNKKQNKLKHSFQLCNFTIANLLESIVANKHKCKLQGSPES